MPDAIENNAKISAILQKLPVFADLQPGDYEHILKISVPARFEDGDTIFVEGDSSPCMFVLLSGKIQLRTHDQGKIHTMQSGELLGEIGMIAQQPRTATAIAVMPSVLLQINSDAFERLLNRAPHICFTIMRNVTRNLSDHIVRLTKSDSLDFIPAE